MSTALQVDALLYGAFQPTAHDYDVLAHALNERSSSWAATIPSSTSRTRTTDLRNRKEAAVTLWA